jgi:hypothetical protein
MPADRISIVGSLRAELVAKSRAGQSLGVPGGTRSAMGMDGWKRDSVAGARLEDIGPERSAIGGRSQRAIIGAEP